MCICYYTDLAFITELKRGSQSSVDLRPHILSKVLGTSVDGSWNPNALRIRVQATKRWEASAAVDEPRENKLPLGCLWFLPLPEALTLCLVGQLLLAWDKSRRSTSFSAFIFFKEKLASWRGKLSTELPIRAVFVSHPTATYTNRHHSFSIFLKSVSPRKRNQ